MSFRVLPKPHFPRIFVGRPAKAEKKGARSAEDTGQPRGGWFSTKTGRLQGGGINVPLTIDINIPGKIAAISDVHALPIS